MSTSTDTKSLGETSKNTEKMDSSESANTPPKSKTEPKIIKQGDKVIKSYIDETTGKIAAYEIGLKLEVSDFSGKWYPAKVVEVDSGENEILVHFENWSSRFDEWIKMDSNRLRPSSNTNVVKIQYKVGEEVEAIWNVDGKRYPGVIQTVLPNDNYQVLFYDGIKYKKKYNQIFKIDPASKDPASTATTTTVMVEPDEPNTSGPIQNPSTTRTKLGKTKALRSLPELTPISLLKAQSTAKGTETPVISSPPTLVPASKRRQQKVVTTPEEPKVEPTPPPPTNSVSSDSAPQLGKRRRTIQDYSALFKTTTRSSSFDSTSTPKSPQSASSTPITTRKKPGPKKKVVEILVDKAPEYEFSFNENSSFELVPPKLEEQVPQQLTPSPSKRRGKKTSEAVSLEDDEPPAIDVITPLSLPEEEPAQTPMKRPRKATEKALALLHAEAKETALRRRSFPSTVSKRSLGQRRRWAMSHLDIAKVPPKLTPVENFDEEPVPDSETPSKSLRSPGVVEAEHVPEIKTPQKEELPSTPGSVAAEVPVQNTPDATPDASSRSKRRRTTFDDEIRATAATNVNTPKAEDTPGTSITTPDDAAIPTKRKRTVTDYSMLLKSRPTFFFDIEQEQKRPQGYSRPNRFRKKPLPQTQEIIKAKSPEIVQVHSPKGRASTPTEILTKPPVPLATEQSVPVVTLDKEEEASTETVAPDSPGKRSLRRSSSIGIKRGNSTSEKEPSIKSPSGIEVSPVMSHPQDNDSLSTITTRRKSIARSASICVADDTCSVTPVVTTVCSKEPIIIDLDVKTDKKSSTSEETSTSKITYPAITIIPKHRDRDRSKSNKSPNTGLLQTFKQKKPKFTSHNWWKKKSKNRDKASRKYENGDSSMTFRKQSPTTSTSNVGRPSRANRKPLQRRGDILTGLSSGRIKNIRDTIFQDGFKKYVLGVPAFKEVSVDIINCYCGLTEEHGLMIQCELCQCWQHGNCYEIETVKDMPVNYVCESCALPEEVRASMEVDWSYDFHKTGKLPKFSGSRNMDSSKKKGIQQSNELMERLYQVQEIVRSTRVNLNILNAQPVHPKLYQWDKPHVTIKEENHQRRFNKLYKPLLRRLLYYNKDDPTYIEKLRKKVEAAVNKRNTELESKIQKPFYESKTFLSQSSNKKLPEFSASSLLKPPFPILLTEKPSTSHALVREERAKKLQKQEKKQMESSLKSVSNESLTPAIEGSPPSAEISTLVSDMLTKVEIALLDQAEEAVSTLKNELVEEVTESTSSPQQQPSLNMMEPLKETTESTNNQQLPCLDTVELLKETTEPTNSIEQKPSLETIELIKETTESTSSQQQQPSLDAVELMKETIELTKSEQIPPSLDMTAPIGDTTELTNSIEQKPSSETIELITETTKLPISQPNSQQQQPSLDIIIDPFVPIPVSEPPTAPSEIPDVVDLNTNPELLMEMDPSDPKFTSIAADLVKSCCEEPEGLIKTLEDLAQNNADVSTDCRNTEIIAGDLPEAGSEQEADLSLTEDGIGTESDLLTFLDEVFVGNLDEGFVPGPPVPTVVSTMSTTSSKPIDKSQASTTVGSNIPMSGPITLTRITPELCRENLTLTIRDQQRIIDEYLDEIEVKVTELERQRYGNPFAYQQPRHIERLHRKIRGMFKNLNLLKTLEVKADTQYRFDRRYDPDTMDESTESDENEYE